MDNRPIVAVVGRQMLGNLHYSIISRKKISIVRRYTSVTRDEYSRGLEWLNNILP